VLSRYRISKVVGDRFGGQFPAEQFAKRGVRYEASSKAKSDIYVDFLPKLNSGTVVLPRNDILVAAIGDEELRRRRNETYL